MHRKLVALNTLGVSFATVLYLGLHGFDRQIEETIEWTVIAAAGTFLTNRLLVRVQGANRERPTDTVDSSPTETQMLNAVFWIPITLLGISALMILALDNPLRWASWMIIVIGGYIGRDVEAIARLSQTR
ncbi:hypothetical protein DES44_2558 [Roseateles depolymerans]|uniref:Uncharacterized protein n=3 Tax=Roseateles depolymerans TaxID=76731 RepID=A0A0U3MEE5_9BURK|nr:hypothetical protein RD2015_2604 [Roseateles depolymerans]REG20052.1 hypothetical protein DES44_2558 [Roseateles depolymerans]